MPPQTPYTADLAGRDPIEAIGDTIARIAAMTANWTPAEFERSYAPDKWSARQILTHLAQSELAFGTRARMALTVPNYVAQSFDQDLWMARELELDGRAAANAYLAAGGMNLAFFERLSDADRRVIGCRYFAGLNEAETASALGVAKGTVKSRTARALTRLRAELGNEFDDEVEQ